MEYVLINMQAAIFPRKLHIIYSFQSVIHVTLATSQSKYSSICSLHILTNLYSSPYLIRSLQVRSIYIYSNTPCTIGLARNNNLI